MNKVRSFKYNITEEEIDKITSQFKELIMTGSFLTSGKYCDLLEERFSTYIGVEKSVSCNSGTSALELIYRGLDLYEKEVLIPTNTFTATATPLLNMNARIKFYDCDSNLQFDMQSILQKISTSTKAIVITHIGGYISPHIEELAEICKQKNILLIEDCAHAHGSRINNKYAGSFGIAGAFSFFSTKVMTTGEGGIVTTSDHDLYKKMKVIRNHGQEEDNIINSVGYNFRMQEISAIIGLSQLEKLDTMIQDRHRVKKMYKEKLKDSDYKFIQENENVTSSLYKLLVTSQSINVENLYNYCKKHNIMLGGRVYPIPCHKQELFKSHNSIELNNAEFYSKSHISLPIYPQMDESEVQRVCDTIKDFLTGTF